MNAPTNFPISEKFRLVAKEWVTLDAAANMLEETKSAVLSQKMLALGDIPVSRAEMQVKGSLEWLDFIGKMVEARRAANLKKVQLKYLEMQFSELQSKEATARAERRL